jgi:hypothetical protein
MVVVSEAVFRGYYKIPAIGSNSEEALITNRPLYIRLFL